MAERLYLAGAADHHIRDGMERFGLSPQQRRVTWLYIHGASHDEIAAELGITHPTVNTYLSIIHSKCGYDFTPPMTPIRLLRRLLSPLRMEPMRRAA